jgi:ribosomal protein S18 acetylase RimI-like enzyme
MPSLRPATPEDASVVAEIWYHGWRDGHLGNVPDELLAIRTEQSFWDRAVKRVDDTTVAVVDDKIAGFIMVAGDEVEQVYVAASHRGTGVAGTLLTEAERLVKANGHTQAWLAVAPGNTRARRFYERQGWVDGGLFEYQATTETGTVTVPCHRYMKL